MHDLRAVTLLKRDVAATLGRAHAALVDGHARRLLPFADWPEHALAARLIDEVQREVHDRFIDTAWPHCPAHTHHPLWFDEGAWRCTENGAAVAAPGDLDMVYFNDAIEGLRRGDFDRLSPLFRDRGEEPCQLLAWHQEGRFANHPGELAEALSNACFLGRDDVAGALIASGVDVTAGTATGMDALHWAANRGQIQTVRMLIALGAPLETINMYGTTVLGTAVWSAINEPLPLHREIIEALLDARASVSGAGYPTGHPEIDRILQAHGD